MTALGDFSSGDVLTAADLNAIGTWTDYTPSVTAQTGTPTTTSFEYAKYTQINNLVIYTFRLVITTAGTAGGAVQVTTPINVAAGAFKPAMTCFGRETQVTGYQVSGEIFGTPEKLAFFYYDNSSIWANNRKISVTTIYHGA